MLALDDFDALRRMVYDHSGIWLADTKQTFFANQLGERLRACNIGSAREYYHYLKYDSLGRVELERLAEAVTIRETWFFRETEPVEAWRASLLPGLLRRPNGQTVRVWSAACSTGEEPYTVALLLREASTDNGVFEIWATDLSAHALEVARLAVYDPHSLRHTAPHWKARYFQPTDDGRLKLADEVKQMVRFGGGNLLDPSLSARLGGMDLILCRNVLIYFDDRSRQKALANLFATLRPGGHLILGAVETLAHAVTPFELARVGKAFLYRRPG